MPDMKCPLGDDCDLTIAWMMGAERAKDTIKAQAAEIERLRAALKQIAKYSADEDEMDWADTVLEMNAIARAAMEGK